MDLKAVEKFMAKNIEDLEKSTYVFETIVRPRYDADVAILKKMRDQHLKLLALKTKVDAGEEVSNEEVIECVPERFR